MAGFDNDVVYAKNVDFSGGFPVSGKVTSNGQLLIGASIAPYIRVATLTAGSAMSITNGAGSIALAVTGGGYSWIVVASASATAFSRAGYIINRPAGQVVMTLNSGQNTGDAIRIVGYSANGWRLAQNAGQKIYFGNQSTTTGVGGYIESTQPNDCVELVAINTTEWIVISSVGNLTIV